MWWLWANVDVQLYEVPDETRVEKEHCETQEQEGAGKNGKHIKGRDYRKWDLTLKASDHLVCRALSRDYS
jgi:hypothetical protein